MAGDSMRQDRQAGFTLIEGMLAAVILSTGLLALAGMQGFSLGRNVDAKELTIVTNLAADMIERIRFNRLQAATYASIDTGVPTTCTAATMQVMALGDCTQWAALVNASNFPNVRGLVVVAPSGPAALSQTLVVVRINWTGAARGEGIVARNKTIAMSAIVGPE